MDRREIAICWLPVAVWMLLIFLLSAQSNPQKVIPKQVEQGIIRDLPKIYDHQAWRRLTINEVAHPLEYTVLSVLIVRALLPKSRQRVRNRLWLAFAWAMVIATGYAFLDELHQSFVPVRTFQLNDLVLDFLGAILGIILAWLYTVIKCQTMKQRDNEVA